LNRNKTKVTHLGLLENKNDKKCCNKFRCFADVFYGTALSGTSKCGIIDQLLFHTEGSGGEKPHC